MPQLKFDEQLIAKGGSIDIAAQLRENSQLANEVATAVEQDGEIIGSVRRSYGLPVLRDEL